MKLRTLWLPLLLFCSASLHLVAGGKEKQSTSVVRQSRTQKKLQKKKAKKKKATQKRKRKKKYISRFTWYRQKVGRFIKKIFLNAFSPMIPVLIGTIVKFVFYLFDAKFSYWVDKDERDLIGFHFFSKKKCHIYGVDYHWVYGYGEAYQAQKEKGHTYAKAYADTYAPLHAKKYEAVYRQFYEANAQKPLELQDGRFALEQKVQQNFTKYYLPAIKQKATKVALEAKEKRVKNHERESLATLRVSTLEMKNKLETFIKAMEQRIEQQKRDLQKRECIPFFPSWWVNVYKAHKLKNKYLNPYRNQVQTLEKKLKVTTKKRKEAFRVFASGMIPNGDLPKVLEELILTYE